MIYLGLWTTKFGNPTVELVEAENKVRALEKLEAYAKKAGNIGKCIIKEVIK